MNQRALNPSEKVMPKQKVKSQSKDDVAASPESLMFDKAEGVSELERLREHRNTLTDEIASLELVRENHTDAETIEALDLKISSIKLEVDTTQQAIDRIKSLS